MVTGLSASSASRIDNTAVIPNFILDLPHSVSSVRLSLPIENCLYHLSTSALLAEVFLWICWIIFSVSDGALLRSWQNSITACTSTRFWQRHFWRLTLITARLKCWFFQNANFKWLDILIWHLAYKARWPCEVWRVYHLQFCKYLQVCASQSAMTTTCAAYALPWLFKRALCF